ncbi:universal stress protein [Paraburkholderia hospita]|uniref:universal stress protein n=1 Tax=Paraburkholderia hospita TaxID=169430 RepID=UPI000DEFEA78|nr:universal stress protein [Paraburkholderia hospita]AXF06374.1 hypothetical protein CUJ88_45970 [Paraburkholderia hospita]
MTPFDRILLCYDGTPEGRQALRCGAALARELQAETHLLAVVDSSWWTSGYDVLSSMAFEMDEDAARSILEEGHCQVDERRLRVWLKSSYPYQITCSTAVETAQPCHVARRSFSMAR